MREAAWRWLKGAFADMVHGFDAAGELLLDNLVLVFMACAVLALVLALR